METPMSPTITDEARIAGFGECGAYNARASNDPTASPAGAHVQLAINRATAERDETITQLRRELGEAENKANSFSNLVCNIQDTVRARGFNQRPVDEAVIALAQERDTLKSRLEALEKVAGGLDYALRESALPAAIEMGLHRSIPAAYESALKSFSDWKEGK